MLVLLRHGESAANAGDVFAGWDDVPLTLAGQAEARAAGQQLRRAGLRFDWACSSVLQRALVTRWLVLDAMDACWVPQVADWRLNERHYGALQGLPKREAVARYGAAPVQSWRRGYQDEPPALDEQRWQRLRQDRRYARLGESIPRSESLQQTEARVQPFWDQVLRPGLAKGQSVLVVSHGNTLRVLLKLMAESADAPMPTDDIPTAQPLCFERRAGQWRATACLRPT